MSNNLLYEPMPRGRNNTRLLTIQSAADSEPIQLVLCNTTLTTGPYDALSYTWGAPKDEQIIYVNGQVKLVRQNLHSFLQHARAAGLCQHIFIDALCINQDDVAERNHQVSIMGEIYINAAKVIVWFGVSISTVIQERKPKQLSSVARKKAHILAERVGDDVTADDIVTICNNEYWSRAWVVQEILLADKIEIHSANVVLDWKNFWDAVASDLDLLQDKSHQSLDVLKGLNFHVSRDMKVNVAHGASTRTTGEHSLLLLLNQWSTSHCADNRDRVYSLRALAREIHDIQVDYNESVLDLAVRVYKHSSEGLEEDTGLMKPLVQALDLWDYSKIARSLWPGIPLRDKFGFRVSFWRCDYRSSPGKQKMLLKTVHMKSDYWSVQTHDFTCSWPKQESTTHFRLVIFLITYGS